MDLKALLDDLHRRPQHPRDDLRHHPRRNVVHRRTTPRRPAQRRLGRVVRRQIQPRGRRYRGDGARVTTGHGHARRVYGPPPYRSLQAPPPDRGTGREMKTPSLGTPSLGRVPCPSGVQPRGRPSRQRPPRRDASPPSRHCTARETTCNGEPAEMRIHSRDQGPTVAPRHATVVRTDNWHETADASRSAASGAREGRACGSGGRYANAAERDPFIQDACTRPYRRRTTPTLTS